MEPNQGTVFDYPHVKAEIARLTAERDDWQKLAEHRGDIQADMTNTIARLTRERDEARAALEAVRRELSLVREAAALNTETWLTTVSERDRLRALLRDVRHSGVEFDAPGVGYVTVQIDRDTWAALAEALEGRDG